MICIFNLDISFFMRKSDMVRLKGYKIRKECSQKVVVEKQKQIINRLHTKKAQLKCWHLRKKWSLSCCCRWGVDRLLSYIHMKEAVFLVLRMNSGLSYHNKLITVFVNLLKKHYIDTAQKFFLSLRNTGIPYLLFIFLWDE